MAKKAYEVDRALLLSSIKKAEASGPLGNRSLLHDEVAKVYNAGHPPREITSSVVMLRINQWNLPILTQAGKRGLSVLTPEQKEKMQAARRGPRTSRGDKFAADPTIVAGFVKMRDEFEPIHQATIDKLVAGSMRAAVKLKCLDCCAGQAREVKFCSCNECPLFAFRPYKPRVGEVDTGEAVVEEEIEEEVEVE